MVSNVTSSWFQPRHCWAIPPNRCSASRGDGGCWDSEKDLVEVISSNCPPMKVASSYWDFERLEVEELPTDSMPSSGSRVFPNCQNCVHRESSNYCWIGQGGGDFSIPSKLRRKMESTCCVAGKAFEASQSRQEPPFRPPPGCCCSSQVLQEGWHSEKDLVEVISSNCPPMKVASSYWDFERLQVEELLADSMPCSVPGGLPNCQNCVHRESSNYCWIGQGGWDFSIPSKLQAKMKSTCCVAGKAFEASQSHRKLHPMCSTYSVAAWGLLYSNKESNPSQHL